MKKFIIWMEHLDKYEGEELEENGNNTDFEYEIGEKITVNNNQIYKCMKKEVVDEKLYQYFKKGRVSYDFNY